MTIIFQSIALYRDFIIPDTIDNNHRASAYYTVGLNYEAMGLLKKTAENFVLAYNADPAHKFAESCIYKAGYYFDIVTQKGEIEQSVGVNLAKQCYLELINKFPNSKHYQEAEDWLKLNL
jgi:tetratricopeptide (TPR) repeat protein